MAEELSLDEARALMLKAIALGNVKCVDGKEEALSRMTLDGEPDFTITAVEMSEGNLRDNVGRWINFDWETLSAGFGSTLFALYDDGRVEINNECMGKNFIKAVLLECKNETVREKLLGLLEGAKLRDEPPSKSYKGVDDGAEA